MQIRKAKATAKESDYADIFMDVYRYVYGCIQIQMYATYTYVCTYADD